MRTDIEASALSEPFIISNQTPNRFLQLCLRLKYNLYSLLDWALIKKILTLSTQRIFSLDGSMEFWVISYLIGQFKNDQGDSTDYQAAANLIANSTNFKICFILFPLMSFFTLGSPLLGKMKVPSAEEIKNNGIPIWSVLNTEAEAMEAQSQYSRLPRNTLLVGAPFAIIAISTISFSNQFWQLLGKSASVVDLIQQFLIPLSLLTPVIVVRFIGECILFMGNKSSTVMSVSMACWLLFGVFTSYFLGMGGIGPLKFREMKILGVFTGFLGQILISCLILMGVVKKSAAFKDFHFLKDFCKWTPTDARQVREIIPVSLANWLAIVAELAAQLAINILAANLGISQLAAQNFVAEISFLFLLWTYALAQVGQQLVGNEIGAKNKIEAARIAKYTLGLSLIPTPIYLIFALKPRFLTDLTLSVDADILQYTDTLIPYACLNSVFYTFQYVMLETLRPTKKFYRPLSLAIIGLWLGVLASHFFSKEQDIYGIARGSLLGGGLALLGASYDFSKNFLMAPKDETYPEAEVSLSKSESKIEYTDGSQAHHPSSYQRTSSNRYGCFPRCLKKLYKRLTGAKEENLTESRAGLQTSTSFYRE